MSEAKTARELFEALLPKYKHDHEYFHNDCGLCQWEKEEYVKVNQALTALDAEQKEKGEISYKADRIDRLIAKHRKYKEKSQDQRIRLIEKYAAEQKERVKLEDDVIKYNDICVAERREKKRLEKEMMNLKAVLLWSGKFDNLTTKDLREFLQALAGKE